MMAPIFEALSEEYKDKMIFVKVDVDDCDAWTWTTAWYRCHLSPVTAPLYPGKLKWPSLRNRLKKVGKSNSFRVVLQIRWLSKEFMQPLMPIQRK